MNTSFEDQASQSTNDQQSETSSVNPHSPRSSSVFNTNSLNGSHLTAHQQLSHQNQQHYHSQESYIYANSANSYHTSDVTRNLISQQQRSAMSLPIPARGAYTGVDKLIMAAMIEESATAAVAAATGATRYMPCGRGIGYFGNVRDTYAQIPTPSNKSELELYRLLERANLLNYFGTFLNFGGDDVQQLVDADEDEFLEIMSLVGMTQKPLHVRRLQKALIEWRENKELEKCSRRPQINFNSTDDNSLSNRHTIDPVTMVVESSAPPITISSSSQSMTTANNNHSQQYVPPHEILIGAPKRLRLMDDLHKRQNNQKQTPKDSAQQLHHNPQQSDTITCKAPTEHLTSSPKSKKSIGDKEDDKLIEVMDSSQSDFEQDNDTNKGVCCSPNSSKFSHSKFSRYRASLQQASSPNQLRS